MHAIIYAIIRLILAFIFLISQIAILPLFLLYKDYRQNSCYRIMFAVCLIDIGELIANGLFIFLTLLNVDYSMDFERFVGAINAASWDVLFVLQLLLALNRCSVVLKNCFLISIKEHELPWERRLFNFLLLVSVGIYVGIILIFTSEYCGARFIKSDFYWTYAAKREWTETVRDIEYKSTGFLPLITFIAYIIIVCVLKWRRTKQNSAELLSPQERRILLQTCLQFFPLSLLMICGYVLPDDASLDMVACLNVGTIVVCGINPFLYLTLNVQFRERFILMLYCRNKKKNKFVLTQQHKTNLTKVAPAIVNNFNNNGMISTPPKRINSMPQIVK